MGQPINLGQPTIEIERFNSLYGLNGETITIVRDRLDTADDVTINVDFQRSTIVTAGGGKIIYGTPSPEAGVATVSILGGTEDPLIQQIIELATIGSEYTSSGSAFKRELFSEAGDVFNTYDRTFRVIFKPNGETDSDSWVYFPRAVITSTPNVTMSAATPQKWALVFTSVGFAGDTRTASVTGNASLSSNTTFTSTANTLSMTVEGVTRIITFPQTAHTAEQIIARINNAFGNNVAHLVNGGANIQIRGYNPGGTVSVRTTYSNNAFTLVFGTITPENASNTAPTGEEIAVVGYGDPTVVDPNA